MKTNTNTYKKTILYVDHTACLGGGEIALLNLLCALDKIRFKPVVILGSEGPFATKLREENIEVVIETLDEAVSDTRKDTLGFKSLLNIRRIWMSLFYSFRIAAIARRVQADLIHTNSLKSDIFGGIAGRLLGIPVIWHIRDNVSPPYLPHKVATLFRHLAYILPTHIVTNSNSTLRTLRFGDSSAGNALTDSTEINGDLLSTRDAQRWHVVYCGCVPEKFESTTKSAAASKNIALVGRIAEWKGQHVFINAASKVLERYPDSTFQIIGAPLFGEEEYEKSLHQMVHSMHLQDKVSFLGFRSDIPELLKNCAIVVHASTIGEPFGQVVVEAMAAGRPVIATQGGALPEIVVEGETGMLVRMGDPTAMADAISNLLGDRPRAELMGAAGRRRVHQLFTVTQTANRIEAIYSSIFDPETAVMTRPQSVI